MVKVSYKAKWGRICLNCILIFWCPIENICSICSICSLFFNVSSNEARPSGNHFFLSSYFHDCWRSMMSVCLFTEVKRHWAKLVLGCVTALLHYCSLRWLCSLR